MPWRYQSARCNVSGQRHWKRPPCAYSMALSSCSAATTPRDSAVNGRSALSTAFVVAATSRPEGSMSPSSVRHGEWLARSWISACDASPILAALGWWIYNGSWGVRTSFRIQQGEEIVRAERTDGPEHRNWYCRMCYTLDQVQKQNLQTPAQCSPCPKTPLAIRLSDSTYREPSTA